MTTENDNQLGEEAIGLVEAALGTSLRGYRRDDETMRELVRMRVEQVLEHEFRRLPQMLYRLDISERQVDEAFDGAQDASEIPDALSSLIIERLREVTAARAAPRAGDDS